MNLGLDGNHYTLSHCEMTSGTNRSNRWTYRVLIIRTRLDEIFAPQQGVLVSDTLERVHVFEMIVEGISERPDQHF